MTSSRKEGKRKNDGGRHGRDQANKEEDKWKTKQKEEQAEEKNRVGVAQRGGKLTRYQAMHEKKERDRMFHEDAKSGKREVEGGAKGSTLTVDERDSVSRLAPQAGALSVSCAEIRDDSSFVDVPDETVTVLAVCRGCPTTFLANDDTACQWAS